MQSKKILNNCFSHADKIQELLKPLFEIFQIDHFFYTELFPEKSKAFFLSNSPSKVEKIVEIGRFSTDHDSFLNEVENGITRKFIWPLNPNDEIGIMLKSGGIRSGMSFITRAGDKIMNVGFASSKRNQSLFNLFFDGDEVFYHFLKYFENEAKEALKSSADNLIDFGNIVSNDYNSFLAKKRACLNAMPIKNLLVKDYEKGVSAYLSKREYECLYLLSRGKSIKQIAYELSLSTRTVESYIAHCKIKLRTTSKFELAEIALKDNIEKLHLITTT